MRINRLKKCLAWFRSLFTKNMVVTGQGFTTDDRTIPTEINLKLLKEHAKPKRDNTAHLVRYRLRDLENFVMVGLTRKQDRVVYKLYHPELQKTLYLDKALFDLLFKSQ